MGDSCSSTGAPGDRPGRTGGGGRFPGGNASGGRLRARALSTAFRALARATPWGERELLGLRRIVPPGGVCVDAGAALGLYTAVLADLVGPRGTVHSVEPLLFAHPVLSAVLKPRSGANIERHTCALGETCEETVIRVPVRGEGLVTGRSFIGSGAVEVGANTEFEAHVDVNIRVTTVDELCADAGIDRIDFLKCDVEGAELSLLRGARTSIEAWHPTLLLEIEERHTRRYGHSAMEVVEWLRERGYAMYVFDGSSWLRASRVVPGIRNYLFRHPEFGGASRRASASIGRVPPPPR